MYFIFADGKAEIKTATSLVQQSINYDYLICDYIKHLPVKANWTWSCILLVAICVLCYYNEEYSA